jgi:hypothetical protein
MAIKLVSVAAENIRMYNRNTRIRVLYSQNEMFRVSMTSALSATTDLRLRAENPELLYF